MRAAVAAVMSEQGDQLFREVVQQLTGEQRQTAEAAALIQRFQVDESPEVPVNPAVAEAIERAKRERGQSDD